jgi:hypothetical protein
MRFTKSTTWLTLALGATLACASALAEEPYTGRGRGAAPPNNGSYNSIGGNGWNNNVAPYGDAYNNYGPPPPGFRGSEYRDLHGDQAAVERLRADIGRDQWRLNEDIRRGLDRAAAEDARDLARDQQRLNALLGDMRHDRHELREFYRGFRDDRRDGWRER